jgi:peptidoglycan hydrolase CwlO-like protein
VAKQIRVHRTYRWKVVAAVAPILLLLISSALYLFTSWNNLQWTFTGVGLSLQVFGIVIAMKGLRDLRQLFGTGGLFKRLTTPPASPPRFTAELINVPSEEELEQEEEESSVADDELAALGQRVEELENHQKKLRERMGDFDHYEKKVKELRKELLQTDRKLRRALIGNLDLETIGFFWLLVGSILVSLTAIL